MRTGCGVGRNARRLTEAGYDVNLPNAEYDLGCLRHQTARFGKRFLLAGLFRKD